MMILDVIIVCDLRSICIDLVSKVKIRFSVWTLHHFLYTPDLSGRIMVWRGCLSVRLSTKLVNRIQTEPLQLGPSKLGTHTTYDKRMNPIDFQGQGSKVKVTSYTLLLNLVNTIQTEPFKLGSSKFVHILLMTRGRHLLIFKVRGQRSRSHAPHCCKTL